MTDHSVPLDRTADEMRRALERTEGICPLCAVVDETVRRQIETLFYEQVTDRNVRAAIRHARGFCRWHARLISEHADALGTALIVQDILINELRAIERGDRRPRRTGRGFGRLFGADSATSEETECPFCAGEREAERLTAESLISGLQDADFAALYRRAGVLCLPHLRLAGETAGVETVWDTVTAAQRTRLQALTGELGELARKYDYRYRHEARGAESDAWRRGLDLTSGAVDH